MSNLYKLLERKENTFINRKSAACEGLQNGSLIINKIKSYEYPPNPLITKQLNTNFENKNLSNQSRPMQGIEENDLSNGLNIYPNPATNQITVDYFIDESSETSLEIYDATGKIVATHDLGKQSNGNHSVTINLSRLSNGLYSCNLRVRDQVISKRIIKN